MTALGVYVHFPFCAHLCPYCDFNIARPGRAGIPHADYRDAVLAELEARLPDFEGRGPAVSLYFGGGTPGLWDVDAVAAVIAAVRRAPGLRADAEVTLEHNPESVDPRRLTALRAAGVNRLSLGTQSFDDAVLARLGRRHGAADNRRAVDAARAAGFDNLSLDLIRGVAGQSAESAAADVRATLALHPEHVSTYGLTLPPRTPYGARARRGEVLTVDEDRQASLFEETRDALAAGGVVPYEVSNAARPGFEAVHNRLYWTAGEYLALGAGAHGFRRAPDHAWGERWENERHAGRYVRAALAGAPAERFRERLDAATLRLERAMTGLRLDAGLVVDPGLERAFGEAARGLERDGLLVREAGRWRATDGGRLLLDTVTTRLVAVDCTPRGAVL